MHYKGLGCVQDYAKAATLFKKGAIAGRPNSMYFYGLCLRNGYGVTANQDSALYWLQKASKKGYKMAASELATSESENNNNAQARTLSQNLKNDFLLRNSSLNQFQKVDAKISKKIIDGEYEGYLVRYDWSGQYAISSSKLKLKLNYQDGKIIGQWIENDTVAIPLSANFNASSLIFDEVKYTRKDHYNPQKGKHYNFKNANLQWSQKNDSVYLIGNIQLFSVKQNEPDKPLFVSLKKYYKKSGKDDDTKLDLVTLQKDEVNVYPNPFVNTLTVDFSIKQKSDVQIQLLTLDGKIVYEKKSGLLDAGSYTFPLYPQNLNAGTYLLKVAYSNSFHTTKIVRL